MGIYIGELADIVGDALGRDKPAQEIIEQLFGDRRRRVDVTFQVGLKGEPVRVTGVLDYVFYDWRTAHQRVLDYKLTPASDPSNDLFQVALYALMHNVQHRTEPDVGVLYLHPVRCMVEMSWDQVYGQRHKLFDLLASMAEWVRYDEAAGAGLKPPGEPTYCPVCKWDKNGQCVTRLGPKHEGRRLTHWSGPLTDKQPVIESTTGVGLTEGPDRPWARACEDSPVAAATGEITDSSRVQPEEKVDRSPTSAGGPHRFDASAGGQLAPDRDDRRWSAFRRSASSGAAHARRRGRRGRQRQNVDGQGVG